MDIRHSGFHYKQDGYKERTGRISTIFSVLLASVKVENLYNT
jgi:hypothetical protein